MRSSKPLTFMLIFAVTWLFAFNAYMMMVCNHIESLNTGVLVFMIALLIIGLFGGLAWATWGEREPW